jgi:hypothetical protein
MAALFDAETILLNEGEYRNLLAARSLWFLDNPG